MMNLAMNQTPRISTLKMIFFNEITLKSAE